MNYYRLHDAMCCALMPLGAPAVSEEEALLGEAPVFYLYPGDVRSDRVSYIVTHSAQLKHGMGDLAAMNTSVMNGLAETAEVSAGLLQAVQARRLVAVNMAHSDWAASLQAPAAEASPQRVHLLGLGNVGANCLLSLMLLGGEDIHSIGIFDRDPAQTARWELEMNQIAGPDGRAPFPPVYPVQKETLFECDVFVFAASVGVPEPGAEAGDVRTMQYEKNKRILAEYARQAREASFTGHFIVLSDPVEMLAFAAYNLSNRNADGKWDGRGLQPDQVEGFGLGVMHGRALFEAVQNSRFATYTEQGRAYGRHGQGLVLATDPVVYDDAASKALTERVERANLEVRALGFKPYVAPAVASGTLSLLALLRGEWKYSSVFMGGIYFGVRNRRRFGAVEIETLPMDNTLWARILAGAAPLQTWAQEEGADDGA